MTRDLYCCRFESPFFDDKRRARAREAINWIEENYNARFSRTGSNNFWYQPAGITVSASGVCFDFEFFLDERIEIQGVFIGDKFLINFCHPNPQEKGSSFCLQVQNLTNSRYGYSTPHTGHWDSCMGNFPIDKLLRACEYESAWDYTLELMRFYESGDCLKDLAYWREG